MIALLTNGLAGCGAQEKPKPASAAPFPFVLPWDDDSETVVNVGRLNPTPAGKDGYVQARDGHFLTEAGRRVRFVGVNIVAGACFPTKAEAEKIAGRLHKFGVNIVRFHHMDASWAAPNIFNNNPQSTQKLDPAILDRLDYFIAQLKQRGVYANLNLHVFRAYKPEDGILDADTLPEYGNVATFFLPRSRELQKQYAHDLLTHENPYTKTTYAADPCVAVVEMNNENSLLDGAWNGAIEKLQRAPRQELLKQWNAWLKVKYSDTAGLKRAWSAQDKPFGPNILLNADLSRGAEHWTLEQNAAPASGKMLLPDDLALPEGADGRVLRINVTALGAQNWNLQLHQAGLNLTEGEPYTVSFWARADRKRPLPVYASIDKGDYHHIGLDATADLTTEWRKFSFAFNAARTLPNHNRLTFVLGDALGTVDFAGLSLRPGSETEFNAEQTLEKGNVPFARPIATLAGHDWIAFLMETEQQYVKEMREYLKTKLGVRASVIYSQASYGGLGGLLRENASDFVDMHAYWQHPDFLGRAWDMQNWRIANTPMTREINGGELPGLARYRLSGKPFTISEYNHPAPNDFQAECVPMLAAFAAMQDWDGFYLFDYNGDGAHWAEDKIRGFFDVDTNPAKMALLPAMAMLFARQDMAFANNELRLRVPEGSVTDLLAKNGADIMAEWTAAGVKGSQALDNRLSVAFGTGEAPDAPPMPKPRDPNAFINTPAPGGPISWQDRGTDKALFVADSPSSKVCVGYVGGRKLDLGGWQIAAGETPRNFGVLALTALDGQPMERSQSLLLTAIANAENSGMSWNKTRTSVGDKWGSGPTLVESVPGTVTIRTVETFANVYTLDATGKRMAKIDSKLYGGQLTFALDPAHKTVWYEIEAGLKK